MPSSSGPGTARSMLSDQDDKAQLPSPVHLQLPFGVQLALKGTAAAANGAGPSDVTSFFAMKDSEQARQVLLHSPIPNVGSLIRY